ncbi:MAG TPA: type IV secretion system protein [Sphingobium sp.]
MACPAISDQAFLGSVIAHLDCQARSIGDGGYHALSQSGSTGAALLAAALTIFIALIGYDLMLGKRFGTREIVVAVVRIGFVLAIATSWPAVNILLYDVVFEGPSDLVRQIGSGTAVSGHGGDLVGRLQIVDWELDELDQRGTGVVSPDTAGQTATGALRRIDMARDLSWLGLARLVFLSSTIAGIALTRFAGGILLALTPIFALLLLFDSARGLFIGWLRGLIAAILGSIFIAISLGVELTLMEPWVASLVSIRRAEIATPSSPIQLLVLALVFGVAMVGLLYLAFRMAQGLSRHATIIVTLEHANVAYRPERAPRLQLPPSEGRASPETGQSRALAVADALTKSVDVRAGQRSISVTNGRSQASDGLSAASAYVPLGQNFRRRTRNRPSASMARRNQT